jgi:uncharacterized protein (TIGR00369 family)
VTLLPKDPEFEPRVRLSFARQKFMATCGARMVSVRPGEVVLEVDFRDDLTQQHGFLHAGVISSVADSACGYAALTLMPADHAVLSVEFKTNLLAPARGERFRATGRVVRAGRTLTVCTAEVVAVGGEAPGTAALEPTLIAVMQATMIAIKNRPGVLD